MRHSFAFSGLALLLLGAPLAAEDSLTRLYSHACVPSAEALERLNLEKSWLTLLPTESPRDGYMAIKILSDQILVQLRSGVICSLDPTDGTIQWRVPFFPPFSSPRPLFLPYDTHLFFYTFHIFFFVS